MKAILTDVTKCIGCNRCVEACIKENSLAEFAPYRWLAADGLSGQRFTSILRHGGYFVRKQCRHCLEPACVSACPVGALQRTPEGAVIYDGGKCLGCRYCMMACPFGIPRYLWESAVPYVRKCTMCYTTRVSQGRQPACTEACPTQATIFGEREELIEEARRSMAKNPGLYQAGLIGEKDVGGTAVLYLSPVPLDLLWVGRKLDERPLPDRTRTAMMAVPPVFVGMGALMGGLYWIIERRKRLAGSGEKQPDEPAAKPEQPSDETGSK